MECFTTGISRWAEKAPEAPALVVAGEGVVTYAMLAEGLARISSALVEKDLAGLRVASLLEWLPAGLAQLAMAPVGLCLPMNPQMPLADVLRALERCEADAVILGDETVHLADSLKAFGAPILRFTLERATPITFALELISPGGRTPQKRDESHIAYILRSSGTTGEPKLIPLTHDYMRCYVQDLADVLELTPADRGAMLQPIYYSAGFVHTLVAPLLTGGSSAFAPFESRHRPLEWAADLKPTWTSNSTTTLRALLDSLPQDRDPRLASYRLMTCGGSHVPEPLLDEATERLGIHVTVMYGSTEAGLVAGPPKAPIKRRPGTVGAVRPNGRVMIRKDDGAEAAAGEVGMVCVRGPSVMPGYIGQEPLNGDWLEMGDLGYLTEDRQLALVGRAKQMINRGGEKVSPVEIQAAAEEHPLVEEAAAFAIPHPRLGEIPGLAVITKGGGAVDPAELRAFLAVRLAPFKVPRRILTLDAFPVGPTLKPQLAVLSEMAENLPRRIVQPVQPLEYQIAEIWRRLLKRSDVGIEDDFFDLGGDSLLATNMLLEIEEITGRSAPDDAVSDTITIAALSEAFSQPTGEAWRPVTEAAPGKGRPFFYCHGDYSTRGFYAFQLAKEMGLGRPVLLVHPDFDRDPNATIEQRAAVAVEDILSRYPDGEIDLGGFCNGGLLAWEIAHQLEARGRAVKKLVLIETTSLNARRSHRLAAPLVKAAGGRVRWMTPLWNLTVLKRGPAQILARIAEALSGKTSEAAAEPSHPDRLKRPVFQVMSSYFPQRLSTDVLCVISQDGRANGEFNPGPWRRFAKAVQVAFVSGNQQECVTTFGPETARVLASFLRDPPSARRPSKARASKTLATST
jgi:oxalate---CoA ligase